MRTKIKFQKDIIHSKTKLYDYDDQFQIHQHIFSQNEVCNLAD